MQSHYQENYYIDDMYADDPEPTPAPFKAEVQPDGKVFIKSADGLVIAEMCFTGHPENVVKDACLLAAAPAMLTALEKILNLCQQHNPTTGFYSTVNPYQAGEIARAAITIASMDQPDLFAIPLT
jgi:hypothetical protein